MKKRALLCTALVPGFAAVLPVITFGNGSSGYVPDGERIQTAAAVG